MSVTWLNATKPVMNLDDACIALAQKEFYLFENKFVSYKTYYISKMETKVQVKSTTIEFKLKIEILQLCLILKLISTKSLFVSKALST